MDRQGVNLISFQMVVVTFSTEHSFYMKIHVEVAIEQIFRMLLFSFSKTFDFVLEKQGKSSKSLVFT